MTHPAKIDADVLTVHSSTEQEIQPVRDRHDTIFDDLDRARYIVQCEDRKTKRRKELGQLQALLAIMRTDYDRRSRLESHAARSHSRLLS